MRDILSKAFKGRLPAFVVLGAVLVFAITNFISNSFFHHIPHVHDEIAYVFQAKIFSLGKFFVDSPCNPSSFNFPHIINNGRWYSQYPPGFPLILLPGVMLGIPWIINPLLAALSIPLFYKLGLEIYGQSEGRWAAILGSLSLWFLLTSSTMLSHTSSMFFFCIFILFLFRSLRSPSLLNGFLAGSGLGTAFLIRPYNIFFITLPLLILLSIRSIKEPKSRLKNMIGLTAVFAVAVLFLLLYNWATTGSPLKMGYIEKYGPSHGIGFGRAGYLGIPHTLEHGLLLLAENCSAINKYLFGWPLSSLIFLLPFLVPMQESRAKRSADILLISSFLFFAIGLYLYWGTVVFIGPRMFFESFPILVLITARGISKTTPLLVKLTKPSAERIIRKVLLCFFCCLFSFAFFYTFPRWLKPPETKDYYRVFTQDFAGTTSKIHNTVSQLQIGHSLIIMKFLFKPKDYLPDGWWASGFLYNDPQFKNRIVYAQDQGQGNEALLRCFPERDAYLYVGTLDKGMLVPLDLGAAGLLYQRPILFRTEREHFVELVASPEELFVAYSAAFRAYLKSIYSACAPNEIDVVRLIQLAEQAKTARRYQDGAYALEAALQVEPCTSARSQLMGSLASLYIKIGDIQGAKRIAERLSDLFDPQVFDVIPERGF